MTPKKLFEELGGLDPELSVCGNDVDYCLRVRKQGLEVLVTPFSRLYHYESKTRGKDIPQSDFNKSVIYRDVIKTGDPY